VTATTFKVKGPTGRTIQPDELLMQILSNGDNPPEFGDRARYTITPSEVPRTAWNRCAGGSQGDA
jgi:hypothetical protein